MNLDEPAKIDKAIALLEMLNGILDAEQQVLKTPELNGLEALVEEKQEMLSTLADMESNLISFLQQSSTDKKVTQLFELLKVCRHRNVENNALTVQGMKNIDRSIAFLRSSMQANSTTTYDTSGKTDSGVDKRNLGHA